MVLKLTKLLTVIALVFAAIISTATAYSVDSISVDAPTKIKMGEPFKIKVNVGSTSPNLRVQLKAPVDLKPTQSAFQELGNNREFTWDMVATRSGYYTYTIEATDGTNTKTITRKISVDYNTLIVTMYTSKSKVQPNEHFTVSGTVKDYFNSNVQDATVTLDFGGNKYTTVTDVNGNFAMDVYTSSTGKQHATVRVTKGILTGADTAPVTSTGSAPESSTNYNSAQNNPAPVNNNPAPTTTTHYTGSGKALRIKVYDTNFNNGWTLADTVCVNGVCVNNVYDYTFYVSGNANIEIRKSGFITYTNSVYVSHDQDHYVYLSRPNGNGFIEFTIMESTSDKYVKAKVTLTDGKKIDVSGKTTIQVPSGQYGIIVEADGYEREIRTINVNPAGTTYTVFLMKPAGKTDSHTPNTVTEQVTSIGVWVLWISAIVSILTLAGFFVYGLYTRNPIRRTESF